MEDKAPPGLMDQKLYAVCERNEGYPSSLEKGRAYRVLPDPTAAEHGMIRVVDESGEDYLYPRERFGTPRPKPRREIPWLRIGLSVVDDLLDLLLRRERSRVRR